MLDPYRFASCFTELPANYQMINSVLMTSVGKVLQLSVWEAGMETYLTKLLNLPLNHEFKAKGPDDEAEISNPPLSRRSYLVYSVRTRAWVHRSHHRLCMRIFDLRMRALTQKRAIHLHSMHAVSRLIVNASVLHLRQTSIKAFKTGAISDNEFGQW